MALIQLGTRDGSLLGNPPVGDYYLFLDSNNGNVLTKRSDIGKDSILEGNAFENQIRVTQSNVATTLGGTIDSDKEYFIDGVIDCTGVEITVPPTGIEVKGYSFDTSKLICSDSNYTMFKSGVSNSGNVLFTDFAIEVNGLNSKVYSLTDATGFNAIECNRVNYDNCTSLGELINYRQGLELGTGRFGGTPELTLTGTWVGGFRITTSIVRMLTDGNYCLFKAGAGFIMQSRFLTDINVDLPANVKFSDFAPANFPNPSTLQLFGALITRNGVSDPLDTNIFPNISHVDKEAVFRDCQGVSNTFEGGQVTVSSESATVISVVGDFYSISGTWTASDLQHFDNPSNGELRHLGNNPREYQANADLIIDGPSNAEIEVRLRVYDDSAGTTSTIFSQRRQVNSLVGGRDVAFFNIHTKAELDINDYAFLEIANNTNTTDLTVELDSYFDLEKR